MMKRTIIRFLSAIILVSGLGTSVLPQEKLMIAVVPESSTALFWNSAHSGVKLGSLALPGISD